MKTYLKHRKPLRLAFRGVAAQGPPGCLESEHLHFATDYGRGRVFHTTLGHDINALSSVDFVVTFQRGTEWAATGKVTQKVPANFPTETAVSPRP